MTFTELGLAEPLLRAIGDAGYDRPTPIQSQAIPLVLAGHDLMACAQTGTGKTAGFTLPILHRLAGRRSVARQPRALVLTPTRELAIQVEDSVRTYGAHLPLTSLAVFGGVGINPQIAALGRGVDILVATPGRLLDHVSQKTVDLSAVEILVLDEADRMLDMGFIHDIRKILALLPPLGKSRNPTEVGVSSHKARQSLMFSATFSDEIRTLAASFLHEPMSVEVARRNTAAEQVQQRLIEVDHEQKRDLLVHLFAEHGWHQVLVFTRTKHGADALMRKLDKSGIKAAALHGNKSQGARVRALGDFKEGRLAALVATDIAARGLDIEALPLVINYELPHVPEDYVHRIGRTGRAGLDGHALSLVSVDEASQLRDIERLIRRTLTRETVPGFEPSYTPRPKPEAPPPRRNGAPGGRPPGQGRPAAAPRAAKAAAPGGHPGRTRQRPRSPHQ